MPSVPASDVFHPVVFGRYHLEERLAVGGMAEIFRAKSYGVHGFEKTLVIKRILPELNRDRAFVEMFINEARVMTRLSHPKIVQVHDFGEVSGHYYIAMEYVDGLDLLELLRTCAKRRVRPTTAIAVHVMAEVLDALDFAHNLRDEISRPLGVVHSDVSPSNIFISSQGEVKLGDFGIARIQGSSSLSEGGGLRGKYGYMSPEQVSGSPIDCRADVFAAGIVLAELLMIRRLFIAKNDLEVLLQVRDARLDRLYKFGQRVPPDLMMILESALARSPDLRYQSAGIFRDALHRYLFDNRRMIRATDVRRFLMRLADTTTPVTAPPEMWQGRAYSSSPAVQELAPPEVSLAEALVPIPSDVQSVAEIADQQTTPPVSTLHAVPSVEHVPQPSVETVLISVSATDAPLRPVVSAGESAGDVPPVVGRKRRIPLAPPPMPPPVPQGLPHTGEEPRLATEQALAAAPELGTESSTNRDFRSHDGTEAPPSPGPAEEVPARRVAPLDTGEVAALRSGARSRAAAELGEPDQTGILQEQSLFRLLFRLAVEEDTGLLMLTVDGAIKEIYVVEGHPHYVSSNQPGELFGQYLVKRGVLSAGELSMALAMLPHFDGRLGDTLVALRLMRPMQVLRHLTYQVREKLLDAFAWSSGSYQYFRNAECSHESAPLGLNGYELLGTGANRISRSIVQEGLEPYLDARLLAVVPPPVPPEVFRMGDLPRQTRDKLDGQRSLRQLLVRFDDPMEQESFERVVFLLIETGLVTRI